MVVVGAVAVVVAVVGVVAAVALAATAVTNRMRISSTTVLIAHGGAGFRWHPVHPPVV